MNKLVAGVLAAFASAAFIVTPFASASGDITCPKGTKYAGETRSTYAECNLDKDAAGQDLMSTISTIINVAIAIIGFVAVVVIILGGFKYMTSAGDSKKVNDAKNTILYGVIGLVISLLAYAIVNFVLGAL